MLSQCCVKPFETNCLSKMGYKNKIALPLSCLRDVDSQEFKSLHPSQTFSVDMEGFYVTFPPEVQYHLLCFSGVQCEVIY